MGIMGIMVHSWRDKALGICGRVMGMLGFASGVLGFGPGSLDAFPDPSSMAGWLHPVCSGVQWRTGVLRGPALAHKIDCSLHTPYVVVWYSR